MYNSPAMPMGTGFMRASRRWICVLAIGRPIGTVRSELAGLALPVGHIHRGFGRAVKVVQFRFHAREESLPELERQRLSAADHAPRRCAHSSTSGSSRKICSIEGTKCKVVTPLARDQPRQVRAVAMPAGKRHHQRGPGHQRPEELPNGNIEAEGRLLQEHGRLRPSDTRPASSRAG